MKAMISSTAIDLPEHRKQAFDACLREEILPIGMEQLPARDATAVQASLEMVDRADIYIGIYAWRYGWVPDGSDVSITEMEFDRALERKQRGELKAILVFIMHEDHPTTRRDVEADAKAQEKLQKFKERASAGRVRLTFKSAEELRSQLIQSLAECKRQFETTTTHPSTARPSEFAGTALDHYNRGLRSLSENDYDGALESLDKAIQLDPTMAYAFYNRGLTHFFKRDDDRAINDFNRALELGFNTALLYRNRANAFSRKGNVQRALADYAQAITLEPKNALAYLNRGEVHENTLQRKLAVADYKTVLRLPGNPELQRLARERLLAMGIKPN